jgi:hypothetical protein
MTGSCHHFPSLSSIETQITDRLHIGGGEGFVVFTATFTRATRLPGVFPFSALRPAVGK